MTQPLPILDTTLASLSIRWEVLGERAVGDGRVVWLRVDPGAARVRVPSAIEALQVEETGSVPRLLVRNPQKQPVLLAGNLVVKGGWQTRAIERSVVIAAGASVLVPVRCVEAGRWSPESAGTARRFGDAENLGISMRRRAQRMKGDELRSSGRYSASQQGMWASVTDELRSSGVESGTSSYTACLDQGRARARQAADDAEIEAPAGCNAALLVPSDGGWWLEAMPTPKAFAKRLQRLLPDLYEVTGGARGAVNASALLEAVWREPLTLLPHLEGALGDSFALAAPTHSGEVIVLGGALAHVSIGATG